MFLVSLPHVCPRFGRSRFIKLTHHRNQAIFNLYFNVIPAKNSIKSNYTVFMFKQYIRKKPHLYLTAAHISFTIHQQENAISKNGAVVNYLQLTEEFANFPDLEAIANDLPPPDISTILDSSFRIADLCRMPSIGGTPWDKNRPINRHFYRIIRIENFHENNSENLYVTHETLKERTSEIYKIKNPHRPDPQIFSPADKEFQQVYITLNSEREKLRAVLESCREHGYLPDDIWQDAIYDAQRNLCFSVRFSKSKSKIEFDPTYVFFNTLQEELAVKLYAAPILGNYADRLSFTRFCEECGRLFFYKLDNARFCSEQCRSIAGRKRRSNK